MLNKEFLEEQYLANRRSVHDIAQELQCSDNKVTYWLEKHNIKKRSISDAIYHKSNPSGDPFAFKPPKANTDWFLYGLGIALFWGEGNKMNKHAVRLGNTDPALVRVFLHFLSETFQVDRSRLRFGLQIFSDTDPKKARRFWIKELDIRSEQFQRIVVTRSKKTGTYSKKSVHGVLTVYFSNMKLRDSILSAIEALQTTSYANVAQSVERIHGKS